jgi:hypothetical protein
MKKTLTIFCLSFIFFCPKNIAQQTFPAKGAEWYFYNYSFFAESYDTQYKYVKDTIVNSIKYAKIIRSDRSTNPSQPFFTKSTILITQSGNSIYELVNTNQVLRWKVNMKIGDFFTLNGGYKCYLDSVETSNINGKKIKTSHLSMDTKDGCKNTFTLYDFICLKKGFDLLKCETDCVQFDCSFPNLCYYRDDIIGEINFSNNSNCKSKFLSEKENETLENTVKIYPNPSNDFINLSFDQEKLKSSELIINDLQGKIIYQQKISDKIEVDNFSEGVYFLQVKKENKIIFREKIVILH